MSIQTSNLAYFLYYLIILYQTIENLKNKLIKFFSLLFIRFPVCFLEKHTPTTTIQSPSLFDMLNSPLLFSPTTTTSLHQIDLLDPTTTTYTRTSMKSIFFFFLFFFHHYPRKKHQKKPLLFGCSSSPSQPRSPSIYASSFQ